MWPGGGSGHSQSSDATWASSGAELAVSDVRYSPQRNARRALKKGCAERTHSTFGV